MDRPVSDLYTADAPDGRSSSSPSEQLDNQHQKHQPSLRSQKYRQLFRLPPEEILNQDFHCALLTGFTLQGHMYLFNDHICFYAKVFRLETKIVISFREVTLIRRVAIGGLYADAIEVVTKEDKHLFTNFKSRDKAFNIIVDRVDPDRAKRGTNQQESNSEVSSPDSGKATCERVECSKRLIDYFNSVERVKDVPAPQEPPAIVESKMESPSRLQVNVEEDAKIARTAESSPSRYSMFGKQEGSDAPKVPEWHMMVAESKLPIKVEEFFNIFLSDEAVGFQESFHKKCGDKEFRCRSWRPHEEYGHIRDVSFQHPIKIYFGSRFGSCQEVQKYKVYRNRHLILETSLDFSDAPLGDCFCVEGLWVLERVASGSKEGCVLRVYTNVAFSKETMWNELDKKLSSGTRFACE